MISSIQINVRVLQKHKWTDKHFEGILLCVQHLLIPILVLVIGVYVSPKCTFTKFTYISEELMRIIDDSSTVIMTGNFNMKSIISLRVQLQ